MGYLSANLLAPATSYCNSLEDRPKRTRKYLHQGPVEEEYCGGPDNPCVFGDDEHKNKPTTVIDFTKPEEKEEVVTTTNKQYQPQAHLESYQTPRKNIVSETKNETQDSVLMEPLNPGVKKSSYFVKGAFHLKKSVTSCINPTGNEKQDLVSAIVEAEKSFQENFSINVKYISNGEHAYDSGKGITTLQFKLGKHNNHYCAEIVAGINPLKK